jgi:hypothetical protein
MMPSLWLGKFLRDNQPGNIPTRSSIRVSLQHIIVFHRELRIFSAEGGESGLNYRLCLF